MNPSSTFVRTCGPGSSVTPSSQSDTFFDNVDYGHKFPIRLPTEPYVKAEPTRDLAKSQNCQDIAVSAPVADREGNPIVERQDAFATEQIDTVISESNEDIQLPEQTVCIKDISPPHGETYLIDESPTHCMNVSSCVHQSHATLQELPFNEEGIKTTAVFPGDDPQRTPNPLYNNRNDSDTRLQNDIADDAAVAGRVDYSLLPIADNPLQKAGRYTVIRGRLPDNHPLLVAASNLGIILVSKKHRVRTEPTDDAARRSNFMQDLTAFLAELGDIHFKIPIIGGGELDLFLLAKEVMLLGGVRNVVRKRAFRVVAQQLGIPRTCTSAASVMKGAYEKLLFHYEQRLAFGKMPQNPGEPVNMKELLSLEREQEKRMRIMRKAKVKRACNHSQRMLAKTAKSYRSGLLEDSQVAPRVHGLHQSARLIALIMTNTDRLEVPSWVEHTPSRECVDDIIRAAQRADVSKVEKASDAILIAMAECLELENSEAPIENLRSGPDLCLAKQICCPNGNSPSSRNAQCFLFKVILAVTGVPDRVRLARNRSAEYLVEALLALLERFREVHLGRETNTHVLGDERQLPLSLCADQKTQDTAAAYCALRILEQLAKNKTNHVRLFLQRDLFLVFGSFLAHSWVHRTFVIPILDAVAGAALLLNEINTCDTLDVFVHGLLTTLEKSLYLSRRPELDCPGKRERKVDCEVFSKTLWVLSTYKAEWGVQAEVITRFIALIAQANAQRDQLAGTVSPHGVQARESLAAASWKLVSAHPSATALNPTFVHGIVLWLNSGDHLDRAVECLRVMHDAQPLNAYSAAFHALCPWHLLSPSHVSSLSKMVSDILNDRSVAGNQMLQLTRLPERPIIDNENSTRRGDEREECTYQVRFDHNHFGGMKRDADNLELQAQET